MVFKDLKGFINVTSNKLTQWLSNTLLVRVDMAFRVKSGKPLLFSPHLCTFYCSIYLNISIDGHLRLGFKEGICQRVPYGNDPLARPMMWQTGRNIDGQAQSLTCGSSPVARLKATVGIQDNCSSPFFPLSRHLCLR